MTKKITSFTHHVTGEGSRISATFSTINENGSLISSNERFNIIVVDPVVAGAIETINSFLEERIPGGDNTNE